MGRAESHRLWVATSKYSELLSTYALRTVFTLKPAIAIEWVNGQARACQSAIVIDVQIDRWPIERLIPRPNNPRTHRREQVANISASLQEFGWTNLD